MTFTARKNPDRATLEWLVSQSESRTLRRITDESNGDIWCWPCEQATHAEGAKMLSVPYSRPPGAGDIVVIE